MPLAGLLHHLIDGVKIAGLWPSIFGDSLPHRRLTGG
jgi:hypothetical protein